MKLINLVLLTTMILSGLVHSEEIQEALKSEEDSGINSSEDLMNMRIQDIAGDVDLSSLTEEQRQMTMKELDDLLAEMKKALGDLNIDDAIHAQNPEDINVSDEDVEENKNNGGSEGELNDDL